MLRQNPLSLQRKKCHFGFINFVFTDKLIFLFLFLRVDQKLEMNRKMLVKYYFYTNTQTDLLLPNQLKNFSGFSYMI